MIVCMISYWKKYFTIFLDYFLNKYTYTYAIACAVTTGIPEVQVI